MKAPARIVTFYSYKGGVGRTAALANTAWILASNGYRVCVIDWDLEAPGLHRYFYPFMLDPELTSTNGLIDFLVDYVNQAMTPSDEPRPDDWYGPFADLSTYAIPVRWDHFSDSGSIHLVVAGRQGPSYAAKVNSFEWQTFYQRFGGGTFIDEVKRQLRAEYDYVLIDSRTGVSDTAGICTVQLPDKLVGCFMHNAQSIEGTAAVAESAVRLRAQGAHLEVFPVPMRVEMAEKERLDRARVFAQQRFSGFLSHLSVAGQTAYWSDVEVIYQPFYAYEEVLATFVDTVDNKFAVLNAIEHLCARLTEGKVNRLIGPPENERMRVIRIYGERFRSTSYPLEPLSDVAGSHPPPEDTTSGDDQRLHADPRSEPFPALRFAIGAAALMMCIVAAYVLIWPVNRPLATLTAILGVVSLGGAVLFIARHLWKRWRTRIVDHLDKALRRRVSRFGRRYREFMLNSLRFIDVKGLATVGFYTPELDEVFVDVSLAYRAPHQIPEGALTQPPADVTDRRSISEFLDRPQPVVLAVIGVPGSGKTTLLRHTARTVCRSRRGRRTVPILLYLRDHVTTIVTDSHVELPQLVGDTLGARGAEEPHGWFAQRLRDGDCVVLLDGLDEVYRQEDRIKVATWVGDQTRQYPRNDFVVTSRPQGYRSAPIDGAVVVQVRSFTDEQITRFVRDWYLAIEKHSTGASGEDVQLRAESAADDLLKRLDANPGLYDLTVNPLLLTMIANVHRFRGALPGSRTDLYAEICQVMLWRRQEAKNLPVELSGSKKESLLRNLAYTMMERRVRDLPRTDIQELIKPALRRMTTRLTEHDLLADLSSDGLLIEREAGLFSFAHLTFQEYLAAMHIRDRGLVHILAESVDDVWWRETALLYATRSDADPIVAACLGNESVTALSLAFDIADQGSELAPELRRQLDNLLDSAGGDVSRQRFKTAVLITRQLRERIRAASGGRVYMRPISAGIYDMFRADTGTPAPDRPTEGPIEPAVGMRGDDAARFVRWINSIIGGEPGYRLPTRAEIDDPAVHRVLAKTPGLTVWLQEGATVWTAPGSPHPHEVDAGMLARHVRADFERSTTTLTNLLVAQAIVVIRILETDRPLEPGDTITRKRHMSVLDRVIGLDRPIPILPSRPDVDHDRTIANAVRGAFVGGAGLSLRPDGIAERDLQRAREIFRDLAPTTAQVMGIALARVSANSPFEVDNTQFANTFLDEARLAGATWMVSLDALEHDVRDCHQRLLTSLAPGPTTWTHVVAERLAELTLPVVSRKRPLTRDAATAIRIGALCLAAEADNRANSVGDLYRKIAAGITLLERRASREAPVTETIILAT